MKDKKLNVLVGKGSEGLEAETCNIPQVSSSKTLNTEFEKAHFKKSKKKNDSDSSEDDAGETFRFRPYIK